MAPSPAPAPYRRDGTNGIVCGTNDIAILSPARAQPGLRNL